MTAATLVTRTAWIGALLGASLWPLPALHGQTRNAPTSSLSASDYIEIQQLVAKYAYALDHDAQGDAFAALFTSHGVLVDPDGPHQGPTAVAALQQQASRSPAPVRHFTVNHVIESSADGAIGKEYFTTVRVGEGGKPNLEFGGHFEDRYVKTHEGWRFMSRQVLGIGSGQQSVTWDPVRVPTAFGPEGPAPKGSLSVMDYIEIRQLVSRYSFVLDTGVDNGDGYAELFTRDGFFLAGNQGAQGVKYEGRDKLAGLARGGLRGPANVANFIADVIIEPTPEGAIGKQYALAYDFKDGRPTAFRHDGDYEDVYAKTADGWRFKSRTFKSARRAQNPPVSTTGACAESASRHDGGGGPVGRPVTSKGGGMSHWKVAIGTACGTLLLTVVAQREVAHVSAKTTALTAQDYIEIQQLVNRYAFALDTCANNGYDYADLYAPDGVFYYGVTNPRKAVGREQLADTGGGGSQGCKKLERATAEKPLPTHVTVNLVIEPSPDGATGRSYLVYPGERGINADPDHSGHVGGYQDVYVKTSSGWRFKSRLHVFPPLVPGTVKLPGTNP